MDFAYTVTANDVDTDGISIGANALTLNSGTIHLAGGTTNAVLGLGSHYVISNSSDHKVNGGGGERRVNHEHAGQRRHVPAGRGHRRYGDVQPGGERGHDRGDAAARSDRRLNRPAGGLRLGHEVAGVPLHGDGVSVEAASLTLNGGAILVVGGIANEGPGTPRPAATLALGAYTLSNVGAPVDGRSPPDRRPTFGVAVVEARTYYGGDGDRAVGVAGGEGRGLGAELRSDAGVIAGADAHVAGGRDELRDDCRHADRGDARDDLHVDGDGRGHLAITLTVEADVQPSFGETVVPPQILLVQEPMAPVSLPRATGGNGQLQYTLTPALPAGLTSTFSPPPGPGGSRAHRRRCRRRRRTR